MEIPDRIRAAVDLLDVQPKDRILEIGCGRGVAAALICERLRAGSLIAVDRSARAIAAASARNGDAVASGRAQFFTLELADLKRAAVGRFNKVLAINVNLFWTGPAASDLALIAELLKPGGRLYLCYDPPGADQKRKIAARLRQQLVQAGYALQTVTTRLGLVQMIAARP